MDPEPAPASFYKEADSSPLEPFKAKTSRRGPEDFLSFRDPSIAVLGLTIAIATFSVPIAAVLSDRSIQRESVIPTALESDGSKPSLPISLTRLGEPSS